MNEMVLVQALRTSYQRIGKPRRVVLGFSGGSDSAALLHALMKLRHEEEFELFCVHVTHGLRDESDHEEEEIKKFIENIELPFYAKRVHILIEGNLEAAAREARYKVYQEALEHFRSSVLALAHHADDQAETMLMHLMRGSGAQGLSGMREWSAPVWRPLLNVTKAEINQYLAFHSITWFDDKSNHDTVFLRNYLRHNILWQLENRQLGSTANMARAASILADEQDAWRVEEDRFLANHAKMNLPFAFIEKLPLLSEHIAFQRRLVRRLAKYAGLVLSFDQTEEVLAILNHKGNKKIQLSKDSHAITTEKRLHILPEVVHSMTIPWLQPAVLRDSIGYGDGVHEQTMDARLLEGALMRQAHKEDRITPLGMTGSQPLRKYLSGKRIDQPLRLFWPVFAKGHQVLWVPGCGISQDVAVSENTAQTVTLRFLELLPDEIMEAKDNV